MSLSEKSEVDWQKMHRTQMFLNLGQCKSTKQQKLKLFIFLHKMAASKYSGVIILLKTTMKHVDAYSLQWSGKFNFFDALVIGIESQNVF